MEACSTSKSGRVHMLISCQPAEASSQKGMITRSTTVSATRSADARVGAEPLQDSSLQSLTCLPTRKIRPFNFVGVAELITVMAALVGGLIRSECRAERVAR